LSWIGFIAVSPPRSRRTICRIVAFGADGGKPRNAFGLFVGNAWIALFVLTVFFPSDMPDPRFGPYG
jgi:hypothetical protein